MWGNYNSINNNTCKDNKFGLSGTYLYDSTIENNICKNNERGIDLGFSKNNVIKNNICSYNRRYGIRLVSSSENILTNNIIMSNSLYGVCLENSECRNNIIYNNQFYYNHGSGDSYDPLCIQACDNGTTNYWNSSSGVGNYWHDWACNNNSNDQNNDGIVDWPYLIDGSSGARDYYPLKGVSDVLEIPDTEVLTPLFVLFICTIFIRKQYYNISV